MKMYDYLENRISAADAIKQVRDSKHKRKTFEELHPDAPKRKPIKHTKEHEEYLDGLKNKNTVKKFYRTILNKSSNFEENLFNKYHKAYVKLSNQDADFLTYVTTFMNSNKTADEKWNEYTSYIKKSINDWNKKHADQPHKQLEEIK